MATYSPPTYTEPLPIFNTIYFGSEETSLTIEVADKRYLKYPVAQGLETLQQIIVNGTTTMNDSVEIQTNYGSSALRSLTISDNTTNQGLDIRPNANNTNNPSVVSGEIVVETLGTQNAETLTLTTTSTNYSAVKIASNSVLIGAGGNTSTPTTSVSVNGSNGLVSINGIDLSFNTTNPPTCNASSTISTADSSNKIPSTAWVKSVIPPAITNNYPQATYFIYNLINTSGIPSPYPSIVFTGFSGFNFWDGVAFRLRVNYTIYASTTTQTSDNVIVNNSNYYTDSITIYPKAFITTPGGSSIFYLNNAIGSTTANTQYAPINASTNGYAANGRPFFANAPITNEQNISVAFPVNLFNDGTTAKMIFNFPAINWGTSTTGAYSIDLALINLGRFSRSQVSTENFTYGEF